MNGRWPSNFVLIHSENCEKIGVKKVKSDGHFPANLSQSRFYGQVQAGMQEERWMADADGLETVDDFRYAEGCPVAKLDEQAGERKGFGGFKPGAERQVSCGRGGYHGGFPTALTSQGHNDSGGPSRFYHNADWSHEVAERLAGADPVHYCPKAARKERDAGLEGLMKHSKATQYGDGLNSATKVRTRQQAREGVNRGKCHNPHPTIKPIALNKWLATLLLPPKEYAPRRILIPFCGTMSEGIGALLAGWDKIVGIDSEQDYCDIGEARMRFWSAKMQETGLSDPKAILKKKNVKKKDSAQIPLDLDSV